MPSAQIVQAMRQAVALHQAGRFVEAERIYRGVLQQDARDADALQLLGLVCHQTGRNSDAVELINKAIAVRPMGVFFLNLSQALRALGRAREALDACRRAVQMEPRLAEAWNNLGSLLQQRGEHDESLAALRKAVELNPRYVFAFNNLGNTLAAMGRLDEAATALRQAIALDPKYAGAYNNLASLLTRAGKLDEAIEMCKQAVVLQPDAAAFANLGVALHTQGRFDEGNAAFGRGAAIDPNHPRATENLLAGMSYSDRFSQQQVFDAHVEWGRRFSDPLLPASLKLGNDRSVQRKLRIGYLSPDFKRHSVAYFFEPILEHHDRSKFEIFAYANVDRADDVTQRLRGRFDHWRDIVALTDEEAAGAIRADGIDVLVDLAGHTVGNRLLVLARKPAPVQMTYLGYPETTGVRAIDYRVTDALADPVGATEAFHTEKLLRVSAPFVRYRPPEQSPAIVDAPSDRNGYLTFGSFNKAAKVGPETIALWAGVLAAFEGSRLIVKSLGLSSLGSRRRLLDGFASHGIDAGRIELIEAAQPLGEHLAMYGRIDIALDTFPYHGTTTTCEALWMGVPVVSLTGQRHVSRVGLSLLTSVGRPEWAANSPARVVSAAREAENAFTGRLAPRNELRERVSEASLCNYSGLAREMEAMYRQAFVAWASDKRYI